MTGPLHAFRSCPLTLIIFCSLSDWPTSREGDAKQLSALRQQEICYMGRAETEKKFRPFGQENSAVPAFYARAEPETR